MPLAMSSGDASVACGDYQPRKEVHSVDVYCAAILLVPRSALPDRQDDAESDYAS